MSQPGTAWPIVLIRGLWMTARSWDRWVEYYRAKGHEVVVPTYLIFSYRGLRDLWFCSL